MNQEVFDNIKKEIIYLIDYNKDRTLSEDYLYCELLSIFKISNYETDKKKEFNEFMKTVINYLPTLYDDIFIHKSEKNGTSIFRYKRDKKKDIEKKDIEMKELILRNNLLKRKITDMKSYRLLINTLAFIGFICLTNNLIKQIM